jgi:hypothetical protein
MSKIGFTGIFAAMLLTGVFSEILRGNQNLWLHDNSNNLKSTSANISIEQDITNTNGMIVGFSCISPKASFFSFQQFYFMVNSSQPNVLFGLVATWSGENLILEIGEVIPIISNLSIPTIIPAGSNLQIHLKNDDTGIITSAQFSVTQSNPESTFLGTGAIDLTVQTLSSGSKALPKLSPILACTFNIVGSSNDTNFSSGSGSITYSSKNHLESSNDLPSGSLFPNINFPISSNVEYGGIKSESHSSFYTQTFNVPTP